VPCARPATAYAGGVVAARPRTASRCTPGAPPRFRKAHRVVSYASARWPARPPEPALARLPSMVPPRSPGWPSAMNYKVLDICRRHPL